MKNKIAFLINKKKFDFSYENINFLPDDFLIVKTSIAAICGSDLHYYRNAGLGTHKLKLPVSLGHECSGIIVDSNKTKFKEGNLVAIDPLHSCIDQNYCNHDGLPRNLCPYQSYLGAAPQIGAFREFLVLHKSQLFDVNHFNANEAAMIEPLSVVLHAVNRIKINDNSKILILGAGGIGALLCAVLKNITEKITILDKLDYRLNHTNKYFKPAKTINISTNKILNDVKNGYLNDEFDIIFDCITNNSSFEISNFLLRPSGKIVIVGIPEFDHIKLNPHKLRIKEADLINVRRSNIGYEHCINFQTKYSLPLDNLITHTFDLSSIQNAFELNEKYKKNIFRAAIVN